MSNKQRIDDVIDELKKMPTAYITDGMDRVALHGGWLSGLVPRTDLKSGSYVGRVLTVQWAPKQNRGNEPISMYESVRQRTDETILMVAGGRFDCFLIGDNVATAARVAGFEAILVDGCVRDSIGLQETGIGIFTVGIEGGYPNDLEVVACNVPVMFRGEWIQPGDIVAADKDGAVVFPAYRASEIVENSTIIANLEIVQREMILREDPLEDIHALLHKKHTQDEG